MLREIASTLKDLPADPQRDGTLCGAAASALFFRYLHEAGLDKSAAKLCDQRVERALVSLAEVELDASLHTGLTGTAWLLAHLLRLDGGADRNEDVDALLIEHVAIQPWRGSHDLLGGLAGLGTYALERWPRPAAAAILSQVIRRLDEIAHHTPEGTYWQFPHGASAYADGAVGMGVAHGLAGVIGVLASARSLLSSESRASQLLADARRWLVTHQLEDDGVTYPAWIMPGETTRPARAAWCVGDPGIASVLLWGAQQTGEPAWEQHALQLGLGAVRRAQERSGVTDASLCHGASGLMLMFQQMWALSGASPFKTAATHWLERTLAFHRPGSGVGGFALPGSEDLGPAALLGGLSGIGLALLASVTTVPPRWNRVLMMSAPLQ